MQISNNSVASFHYILSEQGGEILESSAGADPMTYLHGHNGLLPGLEQALEGKSAGDKFTVTLAPADAFGEPRENSEQRVPLSHLHGEGAGKRSKWKPGMLAVVQTDQGQQQVTVLKVGHTMATVDTNHPMAGKTLVFDIEITEVREPSEEELTHGHAHGPGGHQH